MTNKGKLYLIPNVIADGTQGDVIPSQVKSILPSLKFFLAEDLRTTRRFLSSLRVYKSIEELNFELLNKDTTGSELPKLMKPLLEGNDMGVISESGCPGVADPGALAVNYAHQNKIQVVPLVGPSSILLALMASGLNGQQFAFHGYLPVDPKDASAKIRELELESKKKSQTQIFIETPHRNNSLFEVLTKSLNAHTQLTIAIDVTGKHEFIQTKPIENWRSEPMKIPKEPALFLFLA